MAGWYKLVNLLNTELNPIRHLLALLGARHIVHVSRIRVNRNVVPVLGGRTENTASGRFLNGIRCLLVASALSY